MVGKSGHGGEKSEQGGGVGAPGGLTFSGFPPPVRCGTIIMGCFFVSFSPTRHIPLRYVVCLNFGEILFFLFFDDTTFTLFSYSPLLLPSIPLWYRGIHARGRFLPCADGAEDQHAGVEASLRNRQTARLVRDPVRGA
jgi:hypothetical protein